MAELINLRIARKRKARATCEQQAVENRAKFGRSKLDKIQAKSTSLRENVRLDGHRLNGTPGPGKKEIPK